MNGYGMGGWNMGSNMVWMWVLTAVVIIALALIFRRRGRG